MVKKITYKNYLQEKKSYLSKYNKFLGFCQEKVIHNRKINVSNIRK